MFDRSIEGQIPGVWSSLAKAKVTRSQSNRFKSMVDELVNYKVLMI